MGIETKEVMYEIKFLGAKATGIDGLSASIIKKCNNRSKVATKLATISTNGLKT